jgi:protein TonB
MTSLQSRAARRPRWGVVVAVLLIHLVVVAALVRAFTPDFAAGAVRAVTQAFSIDLPPPAPARTVPPPTAAKPQAASGAPGRRATPRDAAAPKAPLVTRPTQAPPVAGPGRDDSAGAAAEGEGTGAAGTGMGTGAETGGAGTGGGAAPTVKIAGEINSARDYPRATRALRAGAAVVIDLAVGTQGQVTGCRIVQPSPDSRADAITCALAMRRFRFRPALGPEGTPVEAVYRWRQRWFY